MVNAATALRIFLSYGHDSHDGLARRLATDLKNRGHAVFFDEEALRTGSDWELRLEEGIDWIAEDPRRGRMLLLMTPHSVRRPHGFCLNELAKALSRRLSVIPVMVAWCEPPLSICRLQWLNMQDCVPLEQHANRYLSRFEQLTQALESNAVELHGEQVRLLRTLQPLPFEAEIAPHLARFTGRDWLIKRIDEWMADDSPDRLLWITGLPGIGKTALAAWLCGHRAEIVAFHLCRHGHDHKSDPRRCVLNIAYQLSTQLPNYQQALLELDLDRLIGESNAQTLFDELITQPLLQTVFDRKQALVILIDALDEATKAGRNELADFLAQKFEETPSWLKMIVTSRKTEEIRRHFDGIPKEEIEASSAENMQDIKSFLHQQLQDLPFEPRELDSLLERVVEQSEGLFLYATWACRELRRSPATAAQVALPQGLRGIYSHFFDRQFSDVELFRTRVRPGLEVLVAARQGSDFALLQVVLGWSQYELRQFVTALGSLLQESDGQLRFFHQSLIDWLTDWDAPGPYFCSRKEGDRRLATCGIKEWRRSASSMHPYFLQYLPEHLLEVDERDGLAELLSNFEYIDACARRGSIFGLLSQMAKFTANFPVQSSEGEMVKLIEQALRNELTLISQHPETLFQSLWNQCWWIGNSATWPNDYSLNIVSDAALSSVIRGRLEAWRRKKSSRGQNITWLRSLRPARWPLGTAQVRLLQGHTDIIRSVSISPDERKAVTGAPDGTARVWDIDSGATLFIKKELGWVVGTCFCRAGKHWATASDRVDRSQIDVWDITSGERMACYRLPAKVRSNLAVNPPCEQLAVGLENGEVFIWHLDQQAHDQLDLHSAPVLAVAFSPDGKLLASGARDKKVCIWDLERNELLTSLHVGDRAISTVCWSPCQRFFAVGSHDHVIRVFSARNFELVSELRGHQYYVKCLQFSSDGERLYTGSLDSTVRIWESQTGRELKMIDAHDVSIFAIATTADDRLLFTGGADACVRVWDLEKTFSAELLQGHEDYVSDVAFSVDGDHLYSQSSDVIREWDCETGQLVRSFSPDEKVQIELLAATQHSLISAQISGGQTTFFRGQDRQAIAWFPDAIEHLVCFPAKGLWAGSQEDHVYLLKLEEIESNRAFGQMIEPPPKAH